MKISRIFFKNDRNIVFLIVVLFLTFVARIPSLFEPFWYVDEGVDMTVAEGLSRGLDLYKGIFDNKTPGIYLLSLVAIKVLGHSIWSLRIVLSFWVLATEIALFLLTKKLFNQKIAVVAVLVFAFLTTIPFLEGNIANGEIFMILPTVIAALLVLNNRYFLGGSFFAFALLFKIPSLFDFLAFSIFLFLGAKYLLSNVKILSFLFLGFLTPLFLTAFYFFLRGNFADFYFAIFSSNIGYTNYGNYFLIPNGLLIIKGVLPIITSLYLLFKKIRGRKLTNFDLLLIWLAFAIYGSSFGGRNYAHYLIQTLPPLSIVAASLFEKKLRLASLAVLALLIGGIFMVGFRIEEIKLSYYKNFFSYLTTKNQIAYNASFDSKVNRNYSLASFIERNTKKEDYIFLWSNDPQVYFLSARIPPTRFTVAYHIYSYQGAKKEVVTSLVEKRPKFIFVEVPSENNFRELDNLLEKNYTFSGVIENVWIYQLANNKGV